MVAPSLSLRLRAACLARVFPALFALSVFPVSVLHAEPGDLLSAFEINSLSDNGPVLANNDLLGSGAALLGDLDGNGTPDIAVGAVGDDSGGSGSGAVHLQFLGPALSLLSSVVIDADTENGPALSSGDGYGAALAGVGDINGDGTVDLAVGAPLDDTGGSARGAVYLHFLDTAGGVESTVKLASGALGGAVLANGDGYGSSVAALGDFDSDGIGDIAVGVPGFDGSANDQGRVLLHFLRADGSVKQTLWLDGDTENGAQLKAGDGYGSSVMALGDVDGDGIGDLAVGAKGDDSGGADRGALYIHLMAADGSIRSTEKIRSGTAFLPLLENNDQLGAVLTSAPDLDGDGVPELLAATQPSPASNQQAGKVLVLLLNKYGRLKASRVIDSVLAPEISVSNFDRFGSSIAFLGDLNEDGFPELAVGAEGDDAGGRQRGALHILSLDNNHAPVIRGSDQVTVSEGSLLVRAISVYEADGDPVRLSLTGGEDLARFGLNADGELRFVREPDYDNPVDRNRDNVYWVEVTARDDRGGEGRKLYRVAVSNRNDPPVISGTPPSTVLEGRRYYFAPRASDPEDQTLYFSARKLPTWLSLDRDTGVIDGTPGRFDVGVYEDIQLSVVDQGGQVARLPAFSITVVNLNAAPSFSAPGSVTPTVDQVQGGRVVVPAWASQIDDGDDGTQQLVFEVVENSAPALFAVQPTIDAQSGDLMFTPAAAGSARLVVRLGDDGGTARGGVSRSAPVSVTINVSREVLAKAQGQQGSDGQGNDGQGNDGQGNDGQGNDGQGNDGQGNDGQGDDGQGDDGVLAPEAESSSGSSGGGALGAGSFWLLMLVAAVRRQRRGAVRAG